MNFEAVFARTVLALFAVIGVTIFAVEFSKQMAAMSDEMQCSVVTGSNCIVCRDGLQEMVECPKIVVDQKSDRQ